MQNRKLDFARNRAAVMKEMGPNAGLLVFGAREKIRSRDTHYNYRFSSDLYYLSGLTEPESAIFLSTVPGASPFHLFVRESKPEEERWNGIRLGLKGAAEKLGADKVHSSAAMHEELSSLIASVDRLHFTLGNDEAYDRTVIAILGSCREGRRRARSGPSEVSDAELILHRLRMFKQPDELEVMAEAARVSAAGHLAGMKAVRPGMNEAELQGIVESTFKREGASCPSFNSIVAGGDRAYVLHYEANDATLADGELVMVDAGAEVLGYAGDISRTYPVGAAFTPAQRTAYELVLAAQEYAITLVQVGATNQQVHEKTTARLAELLRASDILEPAAAEATRTEGIGEYFPHGTGHYLGLDVHDVGTYLERGNRAFAYRPGMVVTIEPGLYLSASNLGVRPAYRGISIRIEDDVVVTEAGPRVLTAGVPKSVAEIESIRAAALGVK
jgi:Xaa-Pro aminopeptidase